MGKKRTGANLPQVNKKTSILDIVLLVSIGFLLSSSLQFFGINIAGEVNDIINDYHYKDYETFEKVIENCGDEYSYNKLICVNEAIKRNFKYTKPHEDTQEIDETYLKGGVCKDYAELYKYAADKYGFKNEYVFTDLKRGYKHVFNVISDEDFYCIADQKDIRCFSVETPSG